MIVVQKAVKRLALDLAKKRAHKFTRVSDEFVQRVDRHVSTWIFNYIHALPSKGKTIK